MPRIPNASDATIEAEKLRDYLLNTEHRRGGSKARLLHSFGYRRENWQRLETDLREQHLVADASATIKTEFGDRYEIVAPLRTPNGRVLMIRSIWQIDTGTSVPRMITIHPT